MRLFFRAFLFAAWGCGGGTGADPAEAGTMPPLDATSIAMSGAELEAAALPVTDSPSATHDSTSPSDASDGESAADVTSTADAAAPCSSGTATAQVNGATVPLTGCTAYELYATPGMYEYLAIQCASPRLSIQWTPSTGAKSFQYTPSGSAPVYGGSATVTITTLGPVGAFVDGTASAPQLQAVQDGPTLSFQGSFHACRQPDAPDIGH